jgi:hypothetical protein
MEEYKLSLLSDASQYFAPKRVIGCNEFGALRWQLVIVPREYKALPNVIYTFGLHAPPTNENHGVRLFHQFVSGFRAK